MDDIYSDVLQSRNAFRGVRLAVSGLRQEQEGHADLELQQALWGIEAALEIAIDDLNAKIGTLEGVLMNSSKAYSFLMLPFRISLGGFLGRYTKNYSL